MALTGKVHKARKRDYHVTWPRPKPKPRSEYGAAIYTFLFYGTIFILLASAADRVHFTGAQQMTANAEETDLGICQSVDIRNTLETFKRLEGCRVIEGFIQILLFDKVNETELEQLRFPELTEITDYLLLFRVNGLRSVGQLFPNLALIRGQNLFFDNNALIIYEMPSLQEIGLYSLTDILRGSVHIDKNPSLCFVNSIDWTRIIHDKSSSNFLIKSRKSENECPVCLGDEFLGNRTSICPKAPKTNSEEKDRYLCWSRQHCQKICPPNCTACNDRMQCCHPHCLGGCRNDDVTSCTVCRNFTMGFGKCMENCPKGYYKYLGRRCVSRQECINMTIPIEPQPTHHEIQNPYKTFNGSCVLHCPANYMDDFENHTCQDCGGGCKKECPGVNIDSINVAKQLRGCTHITGSLEIQIRGGSNVVAELEENLSMIKEIYGYLKVVRSFPLYSLNFLKNLERIRGDHLESHKYVFVVLDNQNLQELWDWSNKTIKIDRGNLFFHFNPKLCMSKIKMLQHKANLPKFEKYDVASNGDKVACNITTLNVTVAAKNTNYVLLEWNKFELLMDDPRKLLGYIVYLIEAPYQNVTLYDGRDACGQDNWHVDDVQKEENNTQYTHPLNNLRPFTQYAFYVKTYTIATEQMGAQSPIQYFTTKADMPSQPTRLVVTTNSSDSLLIAWAPPLYPNGNVTHYIVSGRKRQSGIMNSKDRNYCKDPISDEKPHTTTPHYTSSNVQKNDTCESSKQSRINIDESEQAARIRFEDELHNQVYVKRTPTRRRRDTHNTTDDSSSAVSNPFPNGSDNPYYSSNDNHIKNVTENSTDIWESFSFPVYGKTQFYINKLHHFTDYDILVQACREKQGDDDKHSRCSSTNKGYQKTLKKVGADNVSELRIANQTTESLTIAWDQPEDPNGMIVAIWIEYKRDGIENSRPYPECITLKDFKNDSMTYTITNISKLYPGKYSLRVRLMSSAGFGDFSPYIYFEVEEQTSNSALVVILVTFVLVSIIGAVAYWLYRKNIKERETRLIDLVNPEYVPSVYVPDEWEVMRKNIDLLKELGQGSFGMVYEGIAHDLNGKSEIRCAVKTVNEHATKRERLEFLKEASVMKAFNTAHVVKLLGVVSEGQPTLVIMELMGRGDLKSYLRSHRPDDTPKSSSLKQAPTLKQILQMAIEIADGMAYLSARKFVHRDLAARNCMVAENLTVKIGDFGMTRDIYETDYYRKGSKGLLPVRWMAPESLKDGVFTSTSDVWSYGVVLWEMATLASQPYQGLSNDQVVRYVIDGGVMERPENCPDKLYTLMRYCWQHKPAARPSFLKLCSLLLDDANANFAQVSFYHSPAGAEARTNRPTPSPNPEDPSTPLRRTLDRITGYTPSESQESDEIDIDTHHQFPIVSENTDVNITANGYISCRAKNGDTQIAQC